MRGPTERFLFSSTELGLRPMGGGASFLLPTRRSRTGLTLFRSRSTRRVEHPCGGSIRPRSAGCPTLSRFWRKGEPVEIQAGGRRLDLDCRPLVDSHRTRFSRGIPAEAAPWPLARAPVPVSPGCGGGRGGARRASSQLRPTGAGRPFFLMTRRSHARLALVCFPFRLASLTLGSLRAGSAELGRAPCSSVLGGLHSSPSQSPHPSRKERD
jgi:hypothetical protein